MPSIFCIDLHIRDHAAVTDHDERLEAEVLFQLFDLRQKGFRIARVAIEDRHGDRATARVAQHAVVHLKRAGLAIAAVAEFGERTGDALEVARRQIEQHEAVIP
jgi:hypothetical protein